MKFLRNNRLFLVLLIPFMVIPWVRIGNFHLLLFNFSHNRLEFLGFGIEIGTYTLIGIVVLLGFGITLTVALTLSRFYCGMLCPNTFFAHFLTLLRSKKKIDTLENRRFFTPHRFSFNVGFFSGCVWDPYR